VNAFRLYGARIKVRPFGQYLLAAEGALGAMWDSTALDLGTQTVKQIRELEFDIWAYGVCTVTVYTDLPFNVMTARAVRVINPTNGRVAVQVILPQAGGAPNYLFGRLVRVTITSPAGFKLFGARIDARTIGVYVEGYEAQQGAVWDSTPFDGGNGDNKHYDEVRFEMDSDSVTSLDVYTDLPGEAMIFRGTFPVTNSLTFRHWVTVPLPEGLYNGTWGIEGRSIRLILSGTSGFRLYKAQVATAKIGTYLAARTLAGQDTFNTLEFDFQSERVNEYKSIEIDLRADGAVTLDVLTSQSELMLVEYTKNLDIVIPQGRQTLRMNIPPGIRGRLLRLQLSSDFAVRMFALRVWTRPLNEPGAPWKWVPYPIEPSEVLAVFHDLPIAETPPVFTWQEFPITPTPPEWAWAPIPVNPTEPTWFWGKVLSVEPTEDIWTWVDVNFQITG